MLSKNKSKNYLIANKDGIEIVIKNKNVADYKKIKPQHR
jgi:hypothetical protein